MSQQETLQIQSTIRKSLIGSPILRKEDFRFLRGEVTYVTDVKLPRMLRALFVRSQQPHAKIISIDTERAKSLPGVVAVLTGKDLELDAEVPCAIKLPFAKYPKHYTMATDHVNFQGEILAVILAEDEYVASDAEELVRVEYESMPALMDAEQAISETNTHRVHEEYPDNLAYNLKLKFGDFDSNFRNSPQKFSFKLYDQRIFAAPIETRAVISSYNSSSGDLTVWSSTQYPHVLRTYIAKALKHSEGKLRVIAPELGGGFGGKSNIYAEDILIPFLAKEFSRPIKWVESRTESFCSTAHARDVLALIDVAVEKDGKIGAMKLKLIADVGPYYHMVTPAFPIMTAFGLPGGYKIPAYEFDVYAVFTNKKITDAFRGVANAEACFFMERTIDLIASKLHLDPIKVRLANYIKHEEFPFSAVTGAKFEDGDLSQSMRKALEILEYDKLRSLQRELHAKGRYIGIGFSSYWELSGVGPPALMEAMGFETGGFESALVRVLPTGSVVVVTGSSSHGQGHETVFSQMAAESLGINLEDVSVVHGDTLNAPFGVGTFASRSAAVGGGAISVACERIKEKATIIAAHLLDVKSSTIEFKQGSFVDKLNTTRSIPFRKIAAEAYLGTHLPSAMEPGLEATCYFNPPDSTFASGTHAAVVEIDPQSGKVFVRRYIAVNDFGTIINPMIVEGQVHGGVLQGVSQALQEEVVYDRESGQLLTTSFMDYLIPTATDPALQSDEFVNATYKTTTSANPLGVKGMGESGTIVAPAAISNAVANALDPFGATIHKMPLKSEAIWAELISH